MIAFNKYHKVLRYKIRLMITVMTTRIVNRTHLMLIVFIELFGLVEFVEFIGLLGFIGKRAKRIVQKV